MNKTNNKQGGFLPVILIVVALLVAGGGYWYKESKKNAYVSEETTGSVVVKESTLTEAIIPSPEPIVEVKMQTSTTTNTVVNPVPTAKTEVPAILSAKEAYLRISAEFDAVKTYADLEAYVLKNGSKAKIAELEKNRAQIYAMSETERNQLVSMLKSMSTPSDQKKVLSEKIIGNTSTLTLTSTGSTRTGTATLLLENNQWKLELESWK